MLVWILFNSKELEIILDGLDWYLSEWYSGCNHSEKEIDDLYKKIKEYIG